MKEPKLLKRISVGDIVSTRQFMILNDRGGSNYIAGLVDFKVIQIVSRRSVKGIIQRVETIKKIKPLGITGYDPDPDHTYDPSIIWTDPSELYSPCGDDESFEKVI